MVSLQQLLDVPHLQLQPRHLAAPQAQVRWVATSELTDPSPFLEGGEILLTTGLDTATWKHEWDPYVQRLVSTGIVAVGLATDLTHTTSPEPLIAACRHHHMNLFEVARETTFVSISQAMVELLHSEEDSPARAALEVQRRLTEAALQEDAPAALVERIGRIGVVASTVAPDGTPDLGPFGPRPDLIQAALIAEAVRKMRHRGLRTASSVATSGSTLLIHPLGVRGRPTRYLITGFTGRITDLQRSTVTTAVALLSLDEERKRIGRQADRRIRDRALELLVHGDRQTANLLHELGPPPHPRVPHRPVVLRAAGPAGQLEDTIETLIAKSLPCGIVANQLVAISKAPKARELADELATRKLRIGLGAISPDLSHSYDTAGHALDLTTDDSPIVTWDHSVNRGILSLVDPDRAAAFSESFLSGLDDGDNSGVLIDTLRSYLLHHGSQLKTAQDLGVHRNTIRHRIQQIEHGIERSLTDPQVRVDAWVALNARRGPA